MYRTKCFLGIFWTLIHLSFVHGQKPLFQSDDILELQLIVDIETILQDRGEDREPHKAMLIQKPEEGPDLSCTLEVEVRGNFRRNPQNCYFPPLKLDFFRKKDPPEGAFEGQNKLKLVTHCQDGDHVLLEYMVYKLYNIITPYSFQTRLARITYQDAKGVHPSVEEYAFFIEDDDDMAERIGGKGIIEDSVTSEEIARDPLTTLHMFQCMIGNLDWYVQSKKNMDIVDMGSEVPPIAVPYDFDFSEMVDAPYTAMYVSGMDRQVIRELCRTPEEVEKVWKDFTEKKDPILSLYKKCKILEATLKRRCIQTLKDFYKKIDDLGEVQTQFQGDC